MRDLREFSADDITVRKNQHTSETLRIIKKYILLEHCEVLYITFYKILLNQIPFFKKINYSFFVYDRQ